MREVTNVSSREKTSRDTKTPRSTIATDSPVQSVVSFGAKRPTSSSGLVARVESAGLGDKATGQVGKRVGSRLRQELSWAFKPAQPTLLITRIRKAIVPGKEALQSNVGYGLKQAVYGNVSRGVLVAIPAFLDLLIPILKVLGRPRI